MPKQIFEKPILNKLRTLDLSFQVLVKERQCIVLARK